MVIFHSYVNVYQRVSINIVIFLCRVWLPEGIGCGAIGIPDVSYNVYKLVNKSPSN